MTQVKTTGELRPHQLTQKKEERAYGSDQEIVFKG
jgi:hypothetical protein